MKEISQVDFHIPISSHGRQKTEDNIEEIKRHKKSEHTPKKSPPPSGNQSMSISYKIPLHLDKKPILHFAISPSKEEMSCI